MQAKTMSERLNENLIYQNSVSPRRRENLFATYSECVSLIRNLEEIVQTCQVGRIAMHGEQEINKDEKTPWVVYRPTEEEKQAFEDFINHITSANKDFCYVSLNYTSPERVEENRSIMSAPEEFDLRLGDKQLPKRVERYVLAHRKDTLMKDAKFIIDGKYTLCYEGKYVDQTVAEAFSNDLFEKKFYYILECAAQYSTDIWNVDEFERKHIDIEVFASQETASLENAILDSLSLMAEESNKILKELFGKRVGSSYLEQAEKQGLLPSATHMQDYLNIRHLLHHQWDTLYSIGKFNENEVEKNASVRRRYLDSYAKLCDKTLKARIQSYVDAIQDFRPLVETLVPTLMIKYPQISNSKFIKDVKDWVKKHPDEVLHIETGYSNKDKKKTLIRQLQNISDKIKIVDKTDNTNFEKLDELMKCYYQRRLFIDIFQQVENRIGQHCLLLGKNFTPLRAWDYFKRKQLITPEEERQWMEYKKIRNELSHKYMDKELNQKVIELLPGISQAWEELDERLNQKMPIMEIVKDNIYRARHENGLVVDIDFAAKKVLNITNSSGKSRQPIYATKADIQKKRCYTESYANGTSITLQGTNIISCCLNTGISIDVNKKHLHFEDGTRIYFDNPERLYMLTQSGEKLITTTQGELIRFVSRGNIIYLSKNDRYTMQNNRQIQIGKDNYLKEDVWTSAKGKKISTDYQKTKTGMILNYSDGTKICLTSTGIKIFHNDIELNYQNRKEFADSYNIQIPERNMMIDKKFTR